MGGPAIADLLFGVVSPSGKLPVTFPKSVGQIRFTTARKTPPSASGHETLLNDIPAEAGQTSLGCTSYYLDAGFGPLFPFGYGLSYGDFSYSDLAIDKSSYGVDDTIKPPSPSPTTVSARLPKWLSSMCVTWWDR